jgi:hypothetical protein
MTAGQPIRALRSSLWPPRPSQAVRGHRVDAKPSLENRLDAYLDLMSALEPTRKTRAAAFRAPKRNGRTPHVG